jgi:hypothetical protein
MLSCEQVDVVVRVKASPGSVCEVSVACGPEPAPERSDVPLRRPVCVAPSRVRRPAVGRVVRAVDVAREVGGAA